MNIVESIRAWFPNPARLKNVLHDRNPDSYCVGGALCLYMYTHGFDVPPERFPTAMQLANAIMAANPNIDSGRAVDAALDVLTANDTGDFDAAWRYLDDALSYRPKSGGD